MKKMIAALALIAISSLSVSAHAEEGEGFRKRHPRRAEVNRRERSEMRRIREGVKSGSLSKDEAKKLRQEVRDVKKEERQDVKANGGYLTKDQKKKLNGELNQTSQEIYKEKHD